MWQRHEGTGKVAPIDWSPVPGGNILIHGDTYEVLVGSEREALDPTVLDENAVPTLRVNHWSTCTRAPRSSGTPTDAQYADWRAHGPDIASLRAGEKPDDD